jgi:SAM-dependent methyltransferase
MLDLGCGYKPYHDLFAPHVDAHIGLDVPFTIHGREMLDIGGTAFALPLANQSCDTVLATEVMEHVADPQAMLGEINRIMVPKGRLILSVPFHEPLHELPYDFYRYTPEALRLLLDLHGFTIERIERRGGTVAVICHLFCSFLYRYLGTTGYPQQMHVRPVAGPLVIGVCSVVQLIGGVIDQQVNDEFDTLGFVVLAYKK